MFDSLKRTARSGRLKTELYMVEREIRQRQEAFGVQLYDYLEPMSKNPNFFSADDRLTGVLRPPLLESQREIAVIYAKRSDLKERQKQAEAKRAAAFPKKAESWTESFSNAAKSTALAAGEAKLSAEMVVLENQLKAQKQRFGLSLYGKFEELEDKEGWLPTDREVRSIYDSCRKDVEVIRKKAKVKMDELETLGVSRKEIEDERNHNNAKENSEDAMYAAPMAPVHDLKPAAAAPPKQDPFASTPTSALPVATPVNNYMYAESDTPVLAYASQPPPPLEAPPPVPPSDSSRFPPGMGPIGGTPMGGAGAMPGTMGGSMGGSFMGNSFSGGAGAMGGGAGMGFHDDDDDEGEFVMGGGPGSGTQQQHPPPNNADPWASSGGDPFAAFASPPSSAPPPPQQQQPGQHKDSNLFLF